MSNKQGPTKLPFHLDELADWELRLLKEQVGMEENRRRMAFVLHGQYRAPELTGDKQKDLDMYHKISYGYNRETCEAIINYEYEKREAE